MDMPGVTFVVDDRGEKVAVQIDLKMHGELWEDVYDNYVADSRRDEPSRPWEEVKEELGLSDS